MSVDCRVYVGLTLEFARDLTSKDFDKARELTEKHPELDMYEYHNDDIEGKLLLIGDGMNGDFLRLIQVDVFSDDSCLGEGNEFRELAAPVHVFNKDLIEKMSDIYEEYHDHRPALTDFRYAIWSQWY